MSGRARDEVAGDGRAGDEVVGPYGIDAAALARRLGARDLTVDGRPGGGGWSNDTLFVTADGRPLVVRLAPAGRSMFPSYDLSHQVWAMRFAAGHGVPVPEIVVEEMDPAVLGRPFFVMARIDGRVPADDDPPFTKAGFLVDASPHEQRRFHDAAVDAVAALHALPVPPFPVVGPQPADHLAAARELAVWCEWTPPLLDEVYERLAADVPVVEPAVCGFLWGDARPANMVVDSRFAVVGLLDWELAGAGPGELDIAWFLEMNHMRAGGQGIAPLPGFPDAAGTWARWEQAVGRPARHTDWFRLFSAYRVSAFMQLYLAAMIHRGRLPAGHKLLGENPGTRRLAELASR